MVVLLTSYDHDRDQKPVNFANDASFHCRVNLMLLFADHGEGIVLAICLDSWLYLTTDGSGTRLCVRFYPHCSLEMSPNLLMVIAAGNHPISSAQLCPLRMGRITGDRAQLGAIRVN